MGTPHRTVRRSNEMAFALSLYNHPPFCNLLLLLHNPSSSSSSSSSSMQSPAPFSFSAMDTFLDLNIDPAPPGSAMAVALDSERELEGEIYCDRAKLSLSSLPNDQESESEQRMLEEELERKTRENEKLTEMVRVMCEKCMNLQKQVTCLVIQQKQNSEREEAALDHIRKRKLAAKEEEGDGYGGVCSRRDEEFHRWLKRPRLNANTKVSRVLVHTKASDPSLVVKDGYQWRKYGQKVTRDNPSPRAYYKCSSAPNCPVKKKVQRSVEDPTILVATYEGEHSHASHFQTELSLRSINGGKASTVPVLATIKPSCATVTLDLVEDDVRFNSRKEYTAAEVAAWQQLLVRQMASSLKKDPEFAGIVAGAISDKVLGQTNRD